MRPFVSSYKPAACPALLIRETGGVARNLRAPADRSTNRVHDEEDRRDSRAWSAVAPPPPSSVVVHSTD